MEALVAAMGDQLAGRSERVDLLLPLDRSDLLSGLHRQGHVLSTEYTDDGVRVQAVMPLKSLAGLETFRAHHFAPAAAGETSALPPALTEV